ncbi:MAG: family 20 glycosylhydrolase, partial [Candidatus Marinimicrobia bacterium]|nr:family 20 glycosylhydrolase [Candidatus Neomarinimicrobiota bacterium]
EDTYFSRVDFLEILRYADKRFIEIIPEIDLPGHSRAAIKAMENRYRYYAALGEMDKASEYRLIHPGDDSKYKSVQNFNDNVIDPGLPSTYKFVDVVVSELSEMYRESGLKMKWLHLGGDEVPRGVWENSPAVKKMIEENEELNIAHDLFTYFFIQSAGILEALDCRMVGWEEVVNSVSSGDTDILPQKDYLTPIAYIWNTVWGWDREDWAYRMAEKGYPVILSNVGNLYFDLAYNSDPEEKGLFWAGYHNTRNVFEFTPFDFRKSAWIGRMGHPVDMEKFQAFKALAKSNEKMIYGIQGQLWSERLPDEERLHYMALPKTLALAERAWAKQPDWAVIAKDGDRLSSLDSAWADFTNLIGQKELPRLDKMISDGYSYRIPLPGAVIE